MYCSRSYSSTAACSVISASQTVPSADLETRLNIIGRSPSFPGAVHRICGFVASLVSTVLHGHFAVTSPDRRKRLLSQHTAAEYCYHSLLRFGRVFASSHCHSTRYCCDSLLSRYQADLRCLSTESHVLSLKIFCLPGRISRTTQCGEGDAYCPERYACFDGGSLISFIACCTTAMTLLSTI